MKKSSVAVALVAALLIASASPLLAFQKEGCGSGDCRECHQLSKEDAGKLLKDLVDKVDAVDFSEVQGLWTVNVEKQGNRFPLFLHFSKKYILAGNIFRLGTMENLTEEILINTNRVDCASIPVDDALVYGKPDAKFKFVVFTDPDCPYCRRLHPELKRAVELRPEVSFAIKMFPLAMHPDAKEKARTIICEKSLKILDEAFEGQEIPKATCETTKVDENIELGKKLGIVSAPTLVFPDGRVFPGYRTAEAIFALLDGKPAPPPPPSAAAKPAAPGKPVKSPPPAKAPLPAKK